MAQSTVDTTLVPASHSAVGITSLGVDPITAKCPCSESLPHFSKIPKTIMSSCLQVMSLLRNYSTPVVANLWLKLVKSSN